jgi:hypothetical protein
MFGNGVGNEKESFPLRELISKNHEQNIID